MKIEMGKRYRCGDGPYKGLVGKIVAGPLENMAGMEFNIYKGTHSCSGAGAQGCCWWVSASKLTKVNTVLENKQLNTIIM